MLVSKSVNGCCAGYEANYDKLHDTRPDTEDPDKHKENKTTVMCSLKPYFQLC